MMLFTFPQGKEAATIEGIELANGVIPSDGKVRMEVVTFPEEPPAVKWTLRLSTLALLLTLVFLWEWYR